MRDISKVGGTFSPELLNAKQPVIFCCYVDQSEIFSYGISSIDVGDFVQEAINTTLKGGATLSLRTRRY